MFLWCVFPSFSHVPCPSSLIHLFQRPRCPSQWPWSWMMLPSPTLLEHPQLWAELGTRKGLSRASITLWGRLVETFGSCGTAQHTFIHPMFMFSQRQRYFFMSKSEISPCSSFVYSQISWNNTISSRTISSTTLICTSIKNNDISDRLSNGDMNLLYTTSISSSQIPSWISCPSNRRWPLCFKILMTFCYAKWYSSIFIFLMDALLAPWSG